MSSTPILDAYESFMRAMEFYNVPEDRARALWNLAVAAGRIAGSTEVGDMVLRAFDAAKGEAAG